MKKKCTNSACRRVFTPWQDGGVVKCPHCGKVYPRLKPARTRIPTLVLTGWKPGCHKAPAIKALRDHLNITSREVILLLREIHDGHVVIRDPAPGQARKEQEKWEFLGFTTRLDWDTPGILPDNRQERHYMVLLTGYEPGAEQDAIAFLRNRGHWAAGAELQKLAHQKIVIRRNLSMQIAKNIAAAAGHQGLSVEILRDRSGMSAE